LESVDNAIKKIFTTDAAPGKPFQPDL